MLIEQQITERRERAAGAIAKILKRPTGAPYGDYSVKSASGKPTGWQCAGQSYSKTTARVRISASILWERVSNRTAASAASSPARLRTGVKGLCAHPLFHLAAIWRDY